MSKLNLHDSKCRHDGVRKASVQPPSPDSGLSGARVTSDGFREEQIVSSETGRGGLTGPVSDK